MNVLYDKGNGAYYIVSVRKIALLKPARLRRLIPVDPQLAYTIAQQYDILRHPDANQRFFIGNECYEFCRPAEKKWYLAKLKKASTGKLFNNLSKNK